MRLYRYVDSTVHDRGATLRLETWEVVKETPKTYLLQYFELRKRMQKGARKIFACVTEEEALRSYVARKDRQIGLLVSQLNHARQRRSEARSRLGLTDPNPNPQGSLVWS